MKQGSSSRGSFLADRVPLRQGTRVGAASAPRTDPVRRGASNKTAFRRGAGRSCPTREGWRGSKIGCLKDISSFFGIFPMAAPYRLRYEGTGYGLPPRSTNSGPARRGDSIRTTRPRMSASEGIQRGESNEPVADGGIVAPNLFHRGRMGPSDNFWRD